MKLIFFARIDIFWKSIAIPLSEAKTHWMVNFLHLQNRLGFEWCHTKVFMQNSSQWCLRNIQLLRTTVNWCWWRFTYTFWHNSNILGCTHCLWLFSFGLSIGMPIFSLFSHKDNVHTELTMLLFFQNPYSILTYILQPYHDFQNNVAIFPKVAPVLPFTK